MAKLILSGREITAADLAALDEGLRAQVEVHHEDGTVTRPWRFADTAPAVTERDGAVFL